MDGDVPIPAVGGERFGYERCTPRVDLARDQTAWIQNGARLADDRARGSETLLGAQQGQRWLPVSHRRWQLLQLAEGDVRRVRHDRAHAQTANGSEPGPVKEVHGRSQIVAEKDGVRLGYGERVARDIRGDDTVEVTFGGQGQRDGARAGADVDYGAATAVLGLEHEIDEDFGLLTRNEHARIDGEGEVAERGAPNGIRERRTLRTHDGRATRLINRSGIDERVAVRHGPEAWYVQDGSDDVPRLIPRERNPATLETRRQLREQGA